jgi:hypothetical protein
MPVRVGDVGRAVTPLAPYGRIEIDGVRHDARSDGGGVEVGNMIIVLGGDPTGYVVRKHIPGSPPLPNHGEPARRGEAFQSSAEVATAENNERRARLAEVRGQMRRGATWAAFVGAVAGAASAWLGLHFDWADESVTPATLYAGSVAAGAAWAVVLYFVVGWFAVHVLPSEDDAVFEPDFVALAVGLVGAGLGFWATFGGEAITVAAQTMGISLAFTALAAGARVVI